MEKKTKLHLEIGIVVLVLFIVFFLIIGSVVFVYKRKKQEKVET